MFQLKLKEQNNLADLYSLAKKPVSFWIDSSGGPEEYCKKSFYGTDPKYYLYGFLNEVSFHEFDSNAITFSKENCFNFIEGKIKEEKANKNGIFVGYFSYDLFQRENVKRASYPDFFFAYFDNCTSFSENISCESEKNITYGLFSQDMSDEEYISKVKAVKDEIKAGNVYQVNLTRKYSLEVKDRLFNELDLYLKLRQASPNPFGCFFKTPFLTILSSSPEEFIFVDNGYIRTRPIKGTLPKSMFSIDSKNQAENIMIVDLERNDLGRICVPGSIKARKLLTIESYKHLNHVVSTVEGKLKDDIGLKKIFEAMFPGGSITGAPKIASMKLIEKLESSDRGAYTGSFGFIKTDGTMNFNILIRTIFLQNNKITFNAGGGIVADSDPLAELDEIKLKAKGILKTLEKESI